MSLSVLRSGSKVVNPSAQPISCLRNLQLNIRLRASIITTTQFLVRLVHLEHIATVDLIGILSPSQRTRARCLDIRARDPRGFLRGISAAVDGSDQLVGERGDDCGAVTTGILLHHLRVPGCVQVGLVAPP